MIDAVFGRQFPIDHLTWCGASFEDPERLQAVFGRLRMNPER